MKRCLQCGEEKRDGQFRYIKYFDARRNICKRCEALERRKRRYLVEQHVKETGFTSGILGRLETQAKLRAARQAEEEILSTLSAEQVKAFRGAQRTEHACGIVFMLSLFCVLTLIVIGKSFQLIAIPILIGLASMIARCYIGRVYTGPKYDEINRHSGTLYPVILQDEKRKRIEFEQFYTSPEWRILRQSFLRTQRKTNGHYICHYCNRPIAHDELTIDHFKPRSEFPDLALTMSNLRIAHRQCNSSKGTTILRDKEFGSPNKQNG